MKNINNNIEKINNVIQIAGLNRFESIDDPLIVLSEIAKQRTLVINAATNLSSLLESISRNLRVEDVKPIIERFSEFNSLALSSLELPKEIFLKFLSKYAEATREQAVLIDFINNNNLKENFENYCKQNLG